MMGWAVYLVITTVYGTIDATSGGGGGGCDYQFYYDPNTCQGGGGGGSGGGGGTGSGGSSACTTYQLAPGSCYDIYVDDTYTGTVCC